MLIFLKISQLVIGSILLFDKLSTTNDAVYDAESTIIDNLLRTKVIRNDASKVFYFEDNNNLAPEDDEAYTLLSSKVDLVYCLNWEMKNYYFPTFQDAWNYVYEFVKTTAIRIAK